MQVYCRAYDFLVNDDLFGDAAQVHAALMQQAGGGWPNLSTEVERAMAAIAELSPSSEAELRSDFDRIKNTWGAVDLVPIQASDLEQTLRLLSPATSERAPTRPRSRSSTRSSCSSRS